MSYDAIVLDDSSDMRSLLVRLIGVRLQCRCLEVGSVAALRACGSEALSSRVAILDINLGEGRESGLDAYSWLSERRYRGAIYFLTGHARHHPLVSLAVTTGAVILEKPVDSEYLLRLVEAAITQAVGSPERGLIAPGWGPGREI